MRRFLDRLYLASGALGGCFIVLICVAMIGQSILREFGVRTGAVNDVVAWMCAAASFFAMAHAFKHGDFVRVTLLLEHLSERKRRVLEIAALLIGTVSVGYLAFWAVRFTYESWQFNELAQGLLPIPIWIPQSSFALGALLLLVAMVDELILVLRGARPTYVVAVEERHAHGDFSSDV
ncbi:MULTISPECIES: TRAP transporter small permease [unclassified Ottowia]|mgnify:CR=1 FL=1|uniref:TRAP transporter small permease subunit n=1 Tax=unclassified Ottowia TaxID=2645081 RepID=UPI002953C767|nr:MULTISPECIES: TRAP transporter small permease [unclassified Ottowia]WOP16553.1 TRAP transporter small permease [Ottowia sp. SB7-C50]HOB66210.1 TRAP transporter small permease [Ottowia sp.]HPZ56702.1 TRAP transporter small permease [Ottowia sp.]HQD47255.1 TRAP transporter small permease [Ottowia sp.]